MLVLVLLLLLLLLAVTYLLLHCVPGATTAVFQGHERERAEHRVTQHNQTYAGAGQHGRGGVTTTVPAEDRKKTK